MTATLNSIAQMAGTSASTVSLVLSGKADGRVSAAKRDDILRIVKECGYHRNRIARGLKCGKTFKVGLCLAGGLERSPIFGNFSSYEIIREAGHRLRDEGYGIDLIQADMRLKPRELASSLAREQADGLLLINWHPAPAARIAPILREQGMPVAAASVMSLFDDSFSWAAIDNDVSTRAALSFLTDSGCRRIAFLCVQAGTLLNRIKIRACKSFAKERGLAPIPIIIAKDQSNAAVTAAVQRYFRAHGDLDAVLLSDNFMAPAVQQAVAGSGIRLCGYGDAGFVELLCSPPIPYMRMPVQDLARTGVELLLKLMKDPARAKPEGRAFVCELKQAEGKR